MLAAALDLSLRGSSGTSSSPAAIHLVPKRLGSPCASGLNETNMRPHTFRHGNEMVSGQSSGCEGLPYVVAVAPSPAQRYIAGMAISAPELIPHH
jgi:hypothetical protein